jgi:hypothetical protein
MYLILKTPSKEYATAVSHELWMLARPRGISDNETSQFYCGTFAHPDGTQVAIGPIVGSQVVHTEADEEAFVNLINDSITAAEALFISTSINAAKGGTISIIELIMETPSIANNLITTEQMQTSGWFSLTEEI